MTMLNDHSFTCRLLGFAFKDKVGRPFPWSLVNWCFYFSYLHMAPMIISFAVIKKHSFLDINALCSSRWFLVSFLSGFFLILSSNLRPSITSFQKLFLNPTSFPLSDSAGVLAGWAVKPVLGQGHGSICPPGGLVPEDMAGPLSALPHSIHMVLVWSSDLHEWVSEWVNEWMKAALKTAELAHWKWKTAKGV